MRILVCPHDFGIGGSQLNAVEIAAAIGDLGHEVTVAGGDGPLRGRIEDLGLDFVRLPEPRIRPSAGLVRALRRLVRDRDIDVVHGYEWPPIIHALLATERTRAVAVGTVMSMAVAPFLPLWTPLVVGTEEIAARETAFGRTDVSVLVPPVDLRENDPTGTYDVSAFRQWAGADPAAMLVVCVGRLARELKLEGLLGAVATIPGLSPDVQLVLVGDGQVREEVVAAADAANARAGRTAVLVPGALGDPRPAYAAADVVLGMGGSALRGMAFGKPVVVQGSQGYWRAVTAESLPDFLWTGWYGIGDDPADGSERLSAELAPLIADADLRATRGAFGHRLVVERFSLQAAATFQVDMYRRAIEAPQSRLNAHEASRFARSFVSHAVARKTNRLRGGGAVDDFNASPKATAAPQTTSTDRRSA